MDEAVLRVGDRLDMGTELVEIMKTHARAEDGRLQTVVEQMERDASGVLRLWLGNPCLRCRAERDQRAREGAGSGA